MGAGGLESAARAAAAPFPGAEAPSSVCTACRSATRHLEASLRSLETERRVEHAVDSAVCDGLNNMRFACRLLVPKLVPGVLYEVASALHHPWCKALGCRGGAAGQDLLRGQAATTAPRQGCDVYQALVGMAHDYAESDSFRAGIKHVADVLCEETFKNHKEGLKECKLIMEFVVPEVQSRVADAFEDSSELCTDLNLC